MSRYATDKETQVLLLEDALKRKNELIATLEAKLRGADKEWARLNARMRSMRKQLEAYKEYAEEEYPESEGKYSPNPLPLKYSFRLFLADLKAKLNK